jgi:hypothetical protein
MSHFRCLIFYLQILFSPAAGGVRNGGGYDPVPYKDWDYCMSPSNVRERKPEQTGDGVQNTDITSFDEKDLHKYFNPDGYRTLRPKKLCFLIDQPEVYPLGYVVSHVDKWIKNHGLNSHPEYLFVAWTVAQFDDQDIADMDALKLLAVGATQRHGLEAFWLSSECVDNPHDDEIIEDIWRMSDVVRGANAMAIILGHPPDRRGQSDTYDFKNMLFGWGQRMWTLPEALLSPQGKPVLVFTRGIPEPELIPKKSLAVQIWEDAPVSRQLMDHYEKSVALTPLELVVVALQCLNNRATEDWNFTPNIKGEMAYVLMGLLRTRPRANLKDSAFQAFARLSIANDSHMLLERLVCVMPKIPNQRWHDTADHWDSQLWDIYPSCQVAGIGEDDSVIIDGVVGASIKWDRFERVAYTNKEAFKRNCAKMILRFSPVVFLTGAILMVTTSKGIGIVLLILGLGVIAASPYLIRLLFTGKLWDTQALFLGFEGYMDIKTIETHLFGACMDRITWSPFNSTLSRHFPGKHGDCEGQDPTSNERIRNLVAEAARTRNVDETGARRRVFTLVDTFTMTVTMFIAERPPVAVLICGAEGGMQRAVLCSYHSGTHTFSRETVLRMETRVLGRMSRISRLRFCFNRSMVGRKPQ